MTQLLSADDLRGLGIQFSRVTLWRLVREGKFPRPLKVSEQRNAWIAEEVETWISARAAERDTKRMLPHDAE
jgi:prophage regulatory protein